MPPFNEAPSLQSGALIAGKYRLRRRIGQGAMGTVWAAFHETTAREVALKLVIQSDQELRARLLREARACGRLHHRNVVEIYDAGETERGEPFLVMPLLNGETLSAVLKRKRRLDAHEAARMARDMARGLGAAHALQIVHRDLKPSNIFLHQQPDEPGEVLKLLDFGVSKMVATGHGFKTATGVIIGSPGYMSPEQVRSLPDVDHRADLWSLGVLLYEMLAGVRPFQGNIEVILVQILKGDIPSVAQAVRNLDPRLADVVTWCLQRDRDRRVSSAAEVAGWLDAIIAPPAAPPRAPSIPDLRAALSPTPAPAPAQLPATAPQGAPTPSAESSWDSVLHEQTTLPLRRAAPKPAPAPHRPIPATIKMPAQPDAPPAQWPPGQPHRAPMTSEPDASRLSPTALVLEARPRPQRGTRVAIALAAIAALLLGAVIGVYSLQPGTAAPVPSSTPNAPAPPSDDVGSPSPAPESPEGIRSNTPAPFPTSVPSGQPSARPGGTPSTPSVTPAAKSQSAKGSPASAPPATGTASAQPPPAPELAAGPFDESAARASLANASNEANSCKPPGGPTGSGKARVLFGNDGHTFSVVLEGPIGGTSIAGCVMSTFRRASVPPFSGSPVSVMRSFTIK